MILYFSATGNSKHVAERIAAATNDKAISIETNPVVSLAADEPLGIVTPTFDWTLPLNVKEFLTGLQCPTCSYLFYVGTFGTTTGGAAARANSIMKKKGRPFDAMFDIRMPDNWTPVFDLSDPEKVAEINRKADLEIEELIEQIKGRVTGVHMDFRLPLLGAVIGEKVYENKRRTKNLTATDTCIGCGLCAKKCPIRAIEMKEKHPVWVKEQCLMCLRCLHHCPKYAIQYGPNTSKHGQYRNPHVKV
jgi:Pyruvate/2-oxoacid:ferredoxin oxidoreductase delta subunit